MRIFQGLIIGTLISLVLWALIIWGCHSLYELYETTKYDYHADNTVPYWRQK